LNVKIADMNGRHWRHRALYTQGADRR